MDIMTGDQRFVEAFGHILAGRALEREALQADLPARLHAVRLAIERYSQAVRLNHENSDAYISRSSAYCFLARNTPGTLIPRELFRRAEADARRALELKHRNPIDYLVIAEALNGAEKKRALKHAMAMATPEAPTPYYSLGLNLAYCYWYESDYEAFLREVNGLIETGEAAPEKPNLFSCFMARALGFEALGHYKQAADVYLQVFEREPTPFMSMNILKSLMRDGNYQAARQFLREHGHSMPENSVRMWMAAVDILDGKHLSPERVDRLVGDIEREPNRFLAGLVYAYVGQLERAREVFVALVKTAEGNPLVWGVTFRWEINQAKALLKAISNVRDARPSSN